MAKTVLVTGCSSGIGRATALKFQREGWNVIAAVRAPRRERELAALENVLVVRLDVTDVASIDAAVLEGIERFGGIDVLVNSAGRGGQALFEQGNDEFVRSMFDVNVFGVMNTSRVVLPGMRARGSGCIINVTSTSALVGAPLGSVYAATKHAVQGLTSAMDLEYRPLGIRVKSVLPGNFHGTRFYANSVNRTSTGEKSLQDHARVLGQHLATVGERLAREQGGPADVREVADKIFECATSDTPVHNAGGGDAVNILATSDRASLQERVELTAALMVPPKPED